MNITNNSNMFCCNDSCKIDVTASNECDNIIRAKKLFIIFTYIVGDFINVLLCSRKKLVFLFGA